MRRRQHSSEACSIAVVMAVRLIELKLGLLACWSGRGEEIYHLAHAVFLIDSP